MELAFTIAAVGFGATLILDLWSLLLTALGAPFPNYTLIGRWIGHFSRGRFTHAQPVALAPAIAGERLIGWTTHYVIGILYAELLVALVGSSWLSAPTVLPALIFGLGTVVAPFFVMQPAMGLGIASSRTPQPTIARLKSLAAHTVFGLGLYFSARVIASN
ncbi:MAG: DUF2938 family protein [Hyphomonadaceae bacterium]